MKIFKGFLCPAAWPSDSSDGRGSKKQESLGVQTSPPSVRGASKFRLLGVFYQDNTIKVLASQMNSTAGNNYRNIEGIKMLLLSPNKHETKLSNYSPNVILFLHSSFCSKKVVLALVMQQNGCCSNEESNPEIL